ncbi:hypothetical protein B0J12DRAFT_431579 [Macrophomina phaseolina]|uniref:Uncharacterized protein n=1 Tax=Macrophomina phaseolina TaxID=35725 RepID=A0ABQ8GK64_9PEZI|nr:hypothetical protein B0J12DRAFT_431579 [Macrophomina phaseolina]
MSTHCWGRSLPPARHPPTRHHRPPHPSGASTARSPACSRAAISSAARGSAAACCTRHDTNFSRADVRRTRKPVATCLCRLRSGRRRTMPAIRLTSSRSDPLALPGCRAPVPRFLCPVAWATAPIATRFVSGVDPAGGQGAYKCRVDLITCPLRGLCPARHYLCGQPAQHAVTRALVVTPQG